MDLESFRKSRGLTQTELAQRLGLRSKGYVSRIETGAAACPLKLALKIERLSGGEVTAASLCPEAAELFPEAGAGTTA